MKRTFYISPIGQAMFETEKTDQERNSEAFAWVTRCLGVIVLVAQIVIWFGR